MSYDCGYQVKLVQFTFPLQSKLRNLTTILVKINNWYLPRLNRNLTKY